MFDDIPASAERAYLSPPEQCTDTEELEDDIARLKEKYDDMAEDIEEQRQYIMMLKQIGSTAEEIKYAKKDMADMKNKRKDLESELEKLGEVYYG